MAYAPSGKLRLGLVGDLIINRSIRCFDEPAFQAVVEFLRSCDVVLGNLEGIFHNWEMSYGSNAILSTMVSEPHILDELKWLGISAVGAANNHAFDSGEAGLLATIENCRRHSLPVCGVGRSIDEAREPVFIDTAKGRIALLSATTPLGLSDAAHAGPPGVGIPGKPGVATLRFDIIHTVPEHVYRTLRDARAALVPYPQPEDLSAFGGSIRPGARFGTSTRCDPDDLESIAKSIHAAKKVSDLVAFSIHCHDNGGDGPYFNGFHRQSIPDFLREFAHACIEAGGDVVFGHGPHILRGIEIHAGRPIFYSLGNFIVQLETVRRVPPQGFDDMKLARNAGAGQWGDAFAVAPPYRWAVEPEGFRSIAAICEFEGGELEAVRLLPLELGFGTPHSQRGRPVLADRDTARKILETLRATSAPFSTEIGDGSGLVRLERDAVTL